MSATKYCPDPDNCTYSDCPTAFCDRNAEQATLAFAPTVPRCGRTTTFSPCRFYRYTLWREWRLPHGLPYPLPLHAASEFAMFIGLNPSTADETQDDPTIRKCVGFAKRWGYGALCMTNIFAFRATSPKDLKKSRRPIGEDNLMTLVNLGLQAGIVVACWGVNGCFNHRDMEVSAVLKDEGVNLRCLRLTKDGFPEHPLYVPYEVTPMRYNP